MTPPSRDETKAPTVRSESLNIAAAIALAALTLSLFMSLRNYGPIGAIRGFHASLRPGEVPAPEISRYVTPPLYDPSTVALVNIVSRGYFESGRFVILGRRYSGQTQYVNVHYPSPLRFRDSTIIFVMERSPNGQWRIQAADTIKVIQDLHSVQSLPFGN